MSSKRGKAQRQSSIMAFFGPASSAASSARTPATAPGLKRSERSENSTSPPSDASIAQAKRTLFSSEQRGKKRQGGEDGAFERKSGHQSAEKKTPAKTQSDDAHRPAKKKKTRRLVRLADDDDDDRDEDFVMDLSEDLAAESSDSDELAADMSIAEAGDVDNGRSDRASIDGNASAPLGKFASGSSEVQDGCPKARKRLDALDLSGEYGEREGDWAAKNEWSVKVRDSAKRAPGDEGYDPSTLFIPRKVLDSMSPFQKQFWELKKEYYNTMLFVKKGAFMEAYDIDADIVHKELGLNYTGGGRAQMRCAGVPEYSLNKHAARLIDLGHRVGIVAQTETANAADKRKSKTGSAGKNSVCQRSLVRILTKATITDDELLRDHRARYVIALLEADTKTTNATGDIVVGVCYVDAASGRITLGEFLDDNRRSWSEKLLSTLRPPEVLVPPKADLSDQMRALVRWISTGSTHVDIFHKSEANGFTEMTQKRLDMYPGAKERLSAEYLSSHPLASRALGAVASYLSELLIDKETLSLGNYILLPEIEVAQGDAGASDSNSVDEVQNHRTKSSTAAGTLEKASGPNLDGSSSTDVGLEDGYDPSRVVGGGLAMDAATMANLEVLSNVVDGSERGALISVIDRAATAAGRRLLRRWIADPLTLSAAINDRLNAVDTLLSIEHTLPSCRRSLASGPDLERALAKLHQFAVVADVAVMFDDTNARRVKDFVKVLRGLETTLSGLEELSCEIDPSSSARRLAWLLKPGCGYSSKAREELDYFFRSCFDFDAAEKDGEIQPKRGAAPAYDSAKESLDTIEDALEEELTHWRRELGSSSIQFYHRGKETYQLDVPADVIHRNGVPSELTPTSESKKTKRFHTSKIQALLRRHVDVSETFADAGVNVLRDIVTRFDERRDVWSGIVKVAAEVDALMGLAIASQGDGSGSMVRPVVLPDSHPEPVYESKELRHPVLAAKAGSSFVSNDTCLGGASHTIALVTGSNCSGKSTLSRQVAVSVILAQIGCYVPAKSLKFRPFDSLFARAGSRDEIARGRSTFMVEMEEAALIVNTASDRSLVIIDELCSGTTAQDAHAISHATLDHLIQKQCLTIFCTHVDALASEFEGRLGNFTMAATVDEVKKTIVFLFRLVPGVTSQSRGIFCARVAGVPNFVCDMAEKVASEFV